MNVVKVRIQEQLPRNFCYTILVHVFCLTHSSCSSGVTFPSGEMQQRLVHSLYQEANITPDQVEYVEAHGTGTKVSANNSLVFNHIVNVFLLQVSALQGHLKTCSIFLI